MPLLDRTLIALPAVSRLKDSQLLTLEAEALPPITVCYFTKSGRGAAAA
jgi:hypothetical protein